LRKGSGEIFTLAIDDSACTGCSVCQSVCNDDALMMTDLSPEIISAHQNTLSVWEHLPDSSSETIQRLLDAKKYNPFSAVLLNRHFNLSLNGKSNTGSDASKSIIHLVTAVAESVRQPKVKELIQQIEDLTSSISQNIHSQLQSSLPSKDFDSLAKVLAEIKEDRKPFEEVVEHLGGSEHLKLVDTKSLKRKVKLAQSLRALMWLLAEGVSGTGRGRTGFVLDGTLPWSNSYPWNNFTAPVVIDMYGSTPELALGIAQGQLTQLLDNIKIIRRAQLESEGNYEPEIQDAQIAELSWNDLTEKEKSFVPPVILAGSKSKIADKDFTAMVKILDCNLPLKIIVTDDGAPAAEHASAEIISGISNLIPAVALQKAFVLKSSLAAPQHLFSGLIEAIGSSKPALVWVHVPSEAQHILPASAFPKIFSLALNSRAFPLFNFKPEREGKLISSKIEINENPQVDSPWMQIEFSYNENGETKNISYSLTWADWAYTLKSWHNHFIPYADDMGKAISVSDYISLAQIDRAGKCPVIFRVNNDESLKKYKVSGEVIDASEACAQSWQLLREISGDLTEFPDKLHLKIETELSEKYERKMAEQKNEYENKFSDFEAEHLQRIRIKLKEKLMMLSQLHSGHSN
jgi:ferredoxin